MYGPLASALIIQIGLFKVSLILSDYSNIDYTYFNYTLDPCKKHFGNFISKMLFKDMTKTGNVSLGCPQRKVSWFSLK